MYAARTFLPFLLAASLHLPAGAHQIPRIRSEEVPVHVSLTADSVPLVGREGMVTATVSVDYPLPEVTLQIELPTGGKIIDVPEAVIGGMAPAARVARTCRVVFDEPGNKFVRAVVKAVEAPGVSWSEVAYLPLNIGTARSAVGLDSLERQPEAVLLEPGTGTIIGRPGAESENARTAELPPANAAGGPRPSLSGGEPVAGTLTVSGTWRFYDRSDAVTPQRDNIVELRRGSDGAHLAYAYTNWSGEFTFPGVTNPGASGVYVRCFTYTSYGSGNLLSVCDLGADQWSGTYYYDTAVYVFADGSASVGSWTIPNGSLNEKAWWIKDDMTKAYWVPPDRTGTHVAEWSPTSAVGTYWDGRIHLKAGDADDTADTVLHEMGHSVMYFIYGNYFPPSDCPSPHYLRGSSGLVCGWTEGWAHIWHMWTQNDPVRSYPGGGSIDLETPTWGTAGWDSGETVEGRVAGAVWDICDSASDGYDTYDGSWNDVWDVVWNVNSDTFAQFWASWKARGHAKHGPVASIYQCTIDYNSWPSFSLLPDRSTNEDTPYDNAIDLWLYASDAESSDGELVYTITGNTSPNCGVSIDSADFVDIVPAANWYGSSTVTISCSDGIRTVSDTFVVTVISVNDPPVLSGIPDRLIATNSSNPNVLDLWWYASDLETSDNNLVYTITANTSPDCGVSIDADDFVDINPTPGWTGFSDVTIRATDAGGLWAEDTFRVVVATPFDRISQARAKANNTWVWLTGKISTAKFDGMYYIEEADRSSGIRVASAAGPEPGQYVTVAGPLSTSYAERLITPYYVTIGSAAPAVAPLGIKNDSLGGAGPDVNTVSVPENGSGAYNVGLLVRTTGRVIQHASGGRFYITDGGSVRDNASGTASVFVYGVPSGYRPPVGSYVSVTGISGASTLGGKPMRVLRPRDDSDIQVRWMSAAFVYDTAPADAQSFKSLLDSNGVPTTMVPLSNVTTADLARYQVILVGTDTGFWLDPAKVSALLAPGTPVIAIGQGGSAFLDAVTSPDLFIGWGNSALGPNETHAYVSGGDIYSYPYTIPYSPGQNIYLYYTPGVTAVTLWDPGKTVTHFLEDFHYQGYAPVCVEQNRFYQWGFTGAPNKMTGWGQQLFVNLVYRTARH